VDEHTIEVAGTPVFYRSAPLPGDGATPLYLHGVPTSSDDWSELLERTGGIAVDLIGFGRTGKGGHLDYTISGESAFLERLLYQLEVRRVSVVGNDWGAAIGLVLALRRTDLVERLALCNPLPLLDGFAWDRLGRMLRQVGTGEAIMGCVPRWLLARTLRSGYADPEKFSEERMNWLWEQFDQGTQRAVLRLYRSAGERELAAAGAELGTLQAPALVVWGEHDPWLPREWADRYVERLPDVELLRLADAGHWPWLESREVVDRIAEFVRG
jgi:pimeloyl-ACP methyl ester carboxylesterase